jgi:hypothetical protein
MNKTKMTTMIASALLLSAAAPAFATHKAWVFTTGGGSCLKAGLEGHRSSSVQVNGAIWDSNTAETKRVICPVNTSGQSPSLMAGDTDIRNPLHDKVAAKGAEVHYVDPSTTDDVQCNMVAVSATGSVIFSDYRTSCSARGGCPWDQREVGYKGTGFIDFADPSVRPNRRIGIPNSNVTPGIRSLVYHCYLPKAASSTQWSGITATKTDLCQVDPAKYVCYE